MRVFPFTCQTIETMCAGSGIVQMIRSRIFLYTALSTLIYDFKFEA